MLEPPSTSPGYATALYIILSQGSEVCKSKKVVEPTQGCMRVCVCDREGEIEHLTSLITMTLLMTENNHTRPKNLE